MTSEDDGAAAARASRGSLGLGALLSAAAACRCRAPAAAASTSTSTSTSTPPPSDASPSDRRGSSPEPEPHPLHGAIARGMVLPRARSRHRRDRSHVRRAEGEGRQRRRKAEGGAGRQDIAPPDSPTAIALKKRAGTLPSSFRSPRSVLDAFDFEGRFDAPGASAGGAASNSDAIGGKDGFAMKKTRSEGPARRHARSGVPGDEADVERTAGLKPSRVRTYHQRGTRGRHSDRQKAGGGTDAPTPPSRGTYPGILPPATPVRREVRPRRRTDTDPRMTSPARRASQRAKSPPVDVDDVPRGSRLTDRVRSRPFARRGLPREESRFSVPGPKTARPTGCRSAPAGLEFDEFERRKRDARRLLNQMGMDVVEDDWYPGASFDTPRRNNGVRARSRSYDCNYHHPLERAYEDFGVERLLVEHEKLPGGDAADDEKWTPRRRAWSSSRSVSLLVRRGLASAGNPNRRPGRRDDRPDGDAAPSCGERATGVISFLRRTGARVRRTTSERVVATARDDGAVELTLEELRLMHRWRTARTAGGVRRGRGPDGSGRGGSNRGGGAPAPARRRGAEDVLSVASSFGDRTLPVDNRRRRFGSGCSI